MRSVWSTFYPEKILWRPERDTFLLSFKFVVFCFVAQPSETGSWKNVLKKTLISLIFLSFSDFFVLECLCFLRFSRSEKQLTFWSKVWFYLLQNTIRPNRIFLKGPRSLVLAFSWFTGTMPHDIKWMISGHRHYALHPPDWLQNPRNSFVFVIWFFFCFQAQRNSP